MPEEGGGGRGGRGGGGGEGEGEEEEEVRRERERRGYIIMTGWGSGGVVYNDTMEMPYLKSSMYSIPSSAEEKSWMLASLLILVKESWTVVVVPLSKSTAATALS